MLFIDGGGGKKVPKSTTQKIDKIIENLVAAEKGCRLQQVVVVVVVVVCPSRFAQVFKLGPSGLF